MSHQFTKNRDKLSQFHFIYNTQMDMFKYVKLKQTEQLSILHGLKTAVKELKRDFKNYITCEAPKDKAKIHITDFTVGLEFGSKKKESEGEKAPKRHLLHLDGYISFDGYCKLRYEEITKLFNEHLSPFNIHGFFNARYVPDNKQNAIRYTKKEGLPLSS